MISTASLLNELLPMPMTQRCHVHCFTILYLSTAECPTRVSFFLNKYLNYLWFSHHSVILSAIYFLLKVHLPSICESKHFLSYLCLIVRGSILYICLSSDHMVETLQKEMSKTRKILMPAMWILPTCHRHAGKYSNLLAREKICSKLLHQNSFLHFTRHLYFRCYDEKTGNKSLRRMPGDKNTSRCVLFRF